MPTYASNLRQARDGRGWSQKQVADAIGVTPSDVSRWERGAVEPGRKYRHLLADLFFAGDVSALYREPTGAAA
jgi:transcriptional regulator with XRE-family HTH domain